MAAQFSSQWTPAQPFQPGAQQPFQPGAQQPFQPGAQQPPQPGAQQPPQPGAQQPFQPGASFAAPVAALKQPFQTFTSTPTLSSASQNGASPAHSAASGPPPITNASGADAGAENDDAASESSFCGTLPEMTFTLPETSPLEDPIQEAFAQRVAALVAIYGAERMDYFTLVCKNVISSLTQTQGMVASSSMKPTASRSRSSTTKTASDGNDLTKVKSGLLYCKWAARFDSDTLRRLSTVQPDDGIDQATFDYGVQQYIAEKNTTGKTGDKYQALLGEAIWHTWHSLCPKRQDKIKAEHKAWFTRNSAISMKPPLQTDAGGTPSFGGAPAFNAPAFGAPAFSAPAFGAPAFGGPAFGGPAFGGQAFGGQNGAFHAGAAPQAGRPDLASMFGGGAAY